MTQTLEILGYVQQTGVWSHPEDRMAAFLGDFIDAGRDNKAVIEQVRAMVDAGTAVAIMGNHELNALHYHARGENWLGIDDGFMRAHTRKNTKQHETFLNEFPLGSEEAEDVMGWFLSLPLFLDLGDIRLVHACWDGRHIDLVKQRLTEACLQKEDLQEVALEQTDFANAVINMLKGPETQLPPGFGFHDKSGTWRDKVRIKWWAQPGSTWRDASLSVPDPLELPDTPMSSDLGMALYGTDEPPVFFGHYKRLGLPTGPDAPNVMCLDYPEYPCAYRWGGERRLSSKELIVA